MDELSTLVEWYATIPKTQETPTNIANILATPTAAWAEDAGLDAARRADGAVRVAAQGACLAPFWVAKYERESAGAWHAARCSFVPPPVVLLILVIRRVLVQASNRLALYLS